MEKRCSAFTLLEIIIVIIIIGVLASLALPKLFSMVESSRGMEAIRAISTIRFSVERCYLNTSDFSQCRMRTKSAENMLDISDPGLSPNSHFGYFVRETPGAGEQSYYVRAIRNTRDNGDTSAVIGMGYNCLIEISGPGPRCSSGSGGTNRISWIASGVYENAIPKN